MDRVFLDANVLFSAAYRPDAGIRRLWSGTGRRLISSGYAAEEARRNLRGGDRRARLERLLGEVEIVPEVTRRTGLSAGLGLPEKDVPILAAAVTAGCTHLLTGDLRHFGPLIGHTVEGVRIERPATYLRGETD